MAGIAARRARAAGRAAASRELRLPLLRAGVYEAVFTLARQQAQSRAPGCFTREVQARLGALCLDLQQADGGARHFFEAEEWAARNPDGPSFETAVTPSRVVTRWSETGRYHLVHLTFHEYLVATALVEQGDVAGLRARVFEPGWSMILRFAAGVFAGRGQLDAVRDLVRALVEPGELLGRAVLDAAAILVEAGIQDSTPLLGYDLRERLWVVFCEGRPLIEEAAALALGILDADWTHTRCAAVLGRRLGLPAPDASESSLMVVRDYDLTRQRALHLLGAIPDTRAEEALIHLVAEPGDDPVAGHLAAVVLADRDRRHVRARLARLVAARPSAHTVACFATYAERSPHPDLVPSMVAVLARAPEPTVVLQLLHALFETATEQAWAEAFAVAGDPERAPPVDVANALAPNLRLVAGGRLAEQGRAWLLDRSRDRRLPEPVRAEVYAELVRVGAAGPELLDWLARGTHDGLLHMAIQEAGEAGACFPVEVEEHLLARTGVAARRALHGVQIGRWLAEDPRFRPVVLEEDTLDARAEVRASAWMALGTVEAVEQLPRMLGEVGRRRRGEEAMALVGAIGLLAPARRTRPGPALAPELQREVTSLLLRLLDRLKPGNDLRQQAADALASWAFGLAGTRLHDRDVRTAMARASAEQGRLAFEDGWIDARGKRRRWGEES